MAIALGNIEIADLRLGATQVKALYLGSEQMWSGEEPGPVPVGDALCFTAAQANSTVQLSAVGSPGSLSLEYSTDGSSWTSYEFTGSAGQQLTLANVDDKVYMRAKTENQTIGSSGSDYYQFIMTGQIDASGNIQTLLKADGSRTDVPTYCYFRIFQGCTSLTTAPSLPATTLAARCYQYMFNGCTSLTTAPELPATTLASNCYTQMFNGCTSLTTAPALPATTLASSCYNNMFNGCSNLASIDVSFTAWAGTATSNWLNSVAATGTFTCPAELPDTRSASRIPEGWTKKEPAATPLCFTAEEANSTVRLDKNGSPAAISLETSTDGSTWTDYSWTGSTGDTVTLTSVGDKVYFRAKTENQTIGSSDSNHYNFVMSGQIAASGNIQTLLKADGSRTDAPTYCFGWLFERCTSLTTASITLPATTLGVRCYQDLFGFCSSLTTAPAVLPATTLSDYCYAGMFHDCSVLTTAPKLSATALAGGSTMNMFLSCSALSSVEVAFTSWTNTSGWMPGVFTTGTFYCPTALGTNETIQRGDHYCPTNWTVVNT